MGIAIHPNWRGGGNAKRLLDYYIHKIFQTEAVRIRGAILTSNVASMTFFRRRGWQFKEISPKQVSVWVDKQHQEPSLTKHT
jgi:N-acetylglutamate synthase-like GNAT family acetyltransferase